MSVAQSLPLSIEVGGSATAVSLQHPETAQAVTAVAVDHEVAVGDSPEIAFVRSSCERVLSGGARVRVVNEGLTPNLTYKGRTFPGHPNGMSLDVNDMATAVSLDGERGVLMLSARQGGCEVIGEDDKAIINFLGAEYGIDGKDIAVYLLFRQVTNYFFIDDAQRPPFDQYLGDTVVNRYKAMLGEDTFKLSLNDSLALVRASLNDAGIDWQNEEMVSAHFHKQATILPVIDQLQQSDRPLSQVQRITVLYNAARDKRFADLILQDWGKVSAPSVLTVLGLAHVDAILEEAEQRGIISSDDFARYERTIRGLGRSVFRWSPIVSRNDFST